MAKARVGKAKGSNTIAFQGEPGANSDMACRAAFPYMTTLPCPTFDTAMAAVQAGRAELAIIPVENSIAGRVADLHSLLPHTRLKIVAEHFQRVEHCLVALPGASLKTIRTVKSHVQALAQCRNFLKKHRFQPLVHADTAGAAREIAEIGDKSVGAIASSLAARIYNLKVLAKNIEDADHNTTRMLVFSREGGHARLAHRAMHDRLPVSGEKPSGRALQGAGRLCHQRRQYRGSWKATCRARASSRRSSMPRSRAIPSSATCIWRSRSWNSSPKRTSSRCSAAFR